MRKWRSRKKGYVTIFAVITLITLLTCAALVIDLARLAIAKQRLQDVADAAALAGAQRLQSGMDAQAARELAAQIAEANTVEGESVTLDLEQDIEVGAWDAENEEIVPWSAAFTDAVVGVTARRTEDSPDGPIPMFFGAMLGVDEANVTASAVASVAVSERPRPPVEVMVVQDGSGSFQEEWGQAVDADWALMDLINNVSREGDRVGFVTFNQDIATDTEWHWHWWYGWYSTEVELTMNMTPFSQEPDAPLPDPMQSMYDTAYGHNPQGYTNPGVAIDWAVDEYINDGIPDYRRAIVLVSDGMPFGPDDATTQQYRDDAIAAANRAETEGVTIHTVTLTSEDHGDYGYGGADFEFNASLTRNGGYAFRTADPQRLQDILITVGKLEVGHPHLFR